jgi:hypothetical protein
MKIYFEKHFNSNNVSPVEKRPEEYVNYLHIVPDLRLQNTTPEHVKKIIKKSSA